MNSEISWNLSQFPETEEGHSVLDVRESSQVAQHKCHFWIIVHSLGVGPSTNKVNRNRFMRASELTNFAFSNHKSHIFLHVYVDFPIFHNFPQFPGIFCFPKITRKRSGFLGIQEISFKVETLAVALPGACPIRCFWAGSVGKRTIWNFE